MRRWIRRLTLVARVTMASLALGYPPAHAACPTLDVACQLDEAVRAGESLVVDVVAPVDTPVDDTIDPVVDPIVDDVLDRVRDVLIGGPVDLPDPIDTGGGGGSHRGGPPVGNEPPVTPSPADHQGRDSLGGRSPDGPRIAGPGPTISAASGIAPPVRADRPSGNDLDEALGGVARSLAIVLALFVLALAFVAIQDRFDRSDPRLALAPVESDMLEFR